jgi:aryl-alcohol dehydrogenase-like predicted oxidoreductase
MRTVTIPGTRLVASNICLGSADIGSKIDRETSFRILDAFVDAGGSFLDTASVYADWRPGPRSVSEKTIGEWFTRSGHRDRVTLGTKGAHPPLDSMQLSRLSREDIVHDVDASLRNLRTDVIDLYWLHRDDPARPVGEIIDVLVDLRQAGKIRRYGCSNWSASRIAEAQGYAEANGVPGFCADQMRWSPAVIILREVADKTIVVMDDDLYGHHVRTGMAAVPYSSQAGGLFQKMAAGQTDRMASDQWRVYGASENRARYVRVRELAERHNTTITGIVLGYMQSHPFVTIPIVGCQSLQQLEDCVSVCDVQLPPQDVAYLEGRLDTTIA